VKQLVPVCVRSTRLSPVRLDEKLCEDSEPFVLVFGESYHPEWVATLHGTALTHVRLNGFENGWIVPKVRAGDVISLSFAAQSRFDKACAVSLAGGAVFLGLLILRRRRIV
jgi:arabinofuranan 3-O-arabinosyltransferase